MKRGTELKLKFKTLQRALKMPLWQVKGILQSLWDFAAENAQRGDVGRFSNAEIAAGIDYDGDASRLVQLLVQTGWIDECPMHRLVVHDWHEHCEEWVRKRVQRSGQDFASLETFKLDAKKGESDNGGKPKRSVRQRPDVSDNSGQRQTTADNGILPEPEPEPEPEPRLPVASLPRATELPTSELPAPPPEVEPREPEHEPEPVATKPTEPEPAPPAAPQGDPEPPGADEPDPEHPAAVPLDEIPVEARAKAGRWPVALTFLEADPGISDESLRSVRGLTCLGLTQRRAWFESSAPVDPDLAELVACGIADAFALAQEPEVFIAAPEVQATPPPGPPPAAPTESAEEAPPEPKPKAKRKPAAPLTVAQQAAFDRFWEVYPRRKNKGRAIKSWRSLAPDDALAEQILAAVERAKRSRDWTKDGGQFIPHPASWLNAQGWLDDDDAATQAAAPQRSTIAGEGEIGW